jgi:hypothetical protein
MKYCRDLRLAGYSDWRLANMAELQGIYDRAANASGFAGHGNDMVVTWHGERQSVFDGLSMEQRSEA